MSHERESGEMNKIMSGVLGKVLVVVALVFGGWEGYQHLSGVGVPVASSNATSSREASSPAITNEGAPASVEFVVRGSYAPPKGRGLILLNSEEDWQDPKNKTVVIPSWLAKKCNIDSGAIVGRTVAAKGQHTTYKGRPQVQASEIAVK